MLINIIDLGRNDALNQSALVGHRCNVLYYPLQLITCLNVIVIGVNLHNERQDTDH